MSKDVMQAVLSKFQEKYLVSPKSEGWNKFLEAYQANEIERYQKYMELNGEGEEASLSDETAKNRIEKLSNMNYQELQMDFHFQVSEIYALKMSGGKEIEYKAIFDLLFGDEEE